MFELLAFDVVFCVLLVLCLSINLDVFSSATLDLGLGSDFFSAIWMNIVMTIRSSVLKGLESFHMALEHYIYL